MIPFEQELGDSRIKTGRNLHQSQAQVSHLPRALWADVRKTEQTTPCTTGGGCSLKDYYCHIGFCLDLSYTV